jgi:predicted nuclease of predicted toxin-antitoxin system
VKLWLDAQLSPEIAAWITDNFAIEAVAVRDVGLRDATDLEIFTAAKQAAVVVITKDSDFSHLIQRLGSPPKVIWLRCGNTSNERLHHIFQRVLHDALALLEAGEDLVEIADQQ